jgi:uncharacterized protein
MTQPAIYTASVPVLKQILTALSTILGKAQAHADAKKYDASALLQARLFPDMFALTRQVQIAADFAKSISARLAGVEVPVMADDEVTIEQLQARIAKVLAFMDGLPVSAFDSAATRHIVLNPGTPRERQFNGEVFLHRYGLPNFYFHVTTAYNLLRQSGVEIGKRDFLGAV